MPEGKKPRDYSGLLPKKGWPARNYQFLRHRIVPQIFKKPAGETKHLELTSPPEGKVRLTWIGHASFLAQFDTHTLLFDPNWANWHGPVKRQQAPGFPLDQLPEVDLVLVSHAHFDHLHKKSLRAVQSRHGIIVPQGSGNLVKRLGFDDVREMKVWDEHHIDDVRILHTPSHHWGARYGHDTHRDYGGFLTGVSGRKIFHCGDSAYFEGFKEIGEREDICIALLPIGAYEAPSGREVHMNPEEAIQAFLDLDADLMIPMHYGTFPLGNEHPDEPVERLLAEARRLDLSDRIIIPEPGVGIEV